MQTAFDQNGFHRTAKYFMDSGRVKSPGEAIELLKTFGLTIYVGQEIVDSEDHQTALLTLVNCARRTFLAGIEILELPSAECVTSLACGQSLVDAVRKIGGTAVSTVRPDWPSAIIGTVSSIKSSLPAWQVTWQGWRGGTIPFRNGQRLSETKAVAITPCLAAAICTAEAFAYYAGDHPMAGRRSSGISLWRPGVDWLCDDPSEAEVAYLPSRLWIIGLGNLGQAFAWLLACLTYCATSEVSLLLQDFDTITPSNESTSLLTSRHDIGKKKTRVIADWLELKGFKTVIEERSFGPWVHRRAEEPGVALCGVDNAPARASLEKAGFGLIVEAGLGAGPQGFRNLSLHTFPASRAAEDIWHTPALSSPDVQGMPAYESLRRNGVDKCGIARLASQTVAVPFVGLSAAALVISELLRRLNNGQALEVASTSLLCPDDIEAVPIPSMPYAFGYVSVRA